MKEKLGRLKLLQAVDQVLDGLKKQKEELPKQLAETEAERAAAQSKVDTLTQTLTDLKTTKRQRELDQSEENDRVKKYDARLRDLKTNREYQALLREIGFAKKASAELNEELSRLRGEIESTQALLDEAQTQLDEQTRAVKGRRTEIEKALKEVEHSYKSEDRRWNELVTEIPKDLLARYNLIRKRTNLVVIPAKDGACQGCFMSLPPQLYNQVRRADKLYTCPNCHRILTYEVPAEALKA